MPSRIFDVADRGGMVSNFAWSPDGSRIAVSSLTLRRVCVFSAVDGRLVARLEDLTGGASSVDFDAAGHVVCAPLDTPGAAATLWDVDRGTTRILPGVAGPAAPVSDNLLFELTVHRRSNMVLASYQHREGEGTRFALALYDLASGALVRSGGPGANILTMSPDGGRAAFVGQSGQVDIMDLATGKIVAHIDANANRVVALAWSPDGSRVVTGARRTGFGLNRQTGSYGPLADTDVAQIWDARSSLRTAIVGGIDRGVGQLAWHPVGPMIAVADDNGSVQLMSSDAPGVMLARFDPDEAPQAVKVAFSPQGRNLAILRTGTSTMEIVDISAGAAG